MVLQLFSILVLTIILTIKSANAIDLIDGKIKITVGTTAGCTDTVTFISQQLAEADNLYGEYLDIKFVPWGRTQRHEDGSLTCQFGVNDCWANRVHRCALDLLDGDQDAQLHYMSCEFASFTQRPAYLDRSYVCAQAVGIRLQELDYCVNFSGRHLDELAEEAAEEPMEVINFVPSIHFNDVLDRGVHDQARQRLASMICFALAEYPETGVTECQI